MGGARPRSSASAPPASRNMGDESVAVDGRARRRRGARGLRPRALASIDGLLVHIGSPRGLDYDEMATLLGLEVGYATADLEPRPLRRDRDRDRGDGARAGPRPSARCASPRSRTASSRAIGTTGHAAFFEGMREGGGPHAETPYVGLAAPVAGAAMATRALPAPLRHRPREARRRRARPARRRAAQPARGDAQAAHARRTTTRSRSIVEPLRLLDCSVPVDTAVALILTRADRAARPARAGRSTSAATRASTPRPNEFIFGQPRARREPGRGLRLRAAGRARAGLRARRRRRPPRSRRCTATTASRRRSSGRSSASASARPARPPTGSPAGASSSAARCPSTPAAAISPRATPTAGARRSRSSASCAGRPASARSPASRSRSGRRRSGTRSSTARERLSLEIRDFPGAGRPDARCCRRARARPRRSSTRCASGRLVAAGVRALRPRAPADRAGLPLLRRAAFDVAAAAAAPATVHSWVALPPRLPARVRAADALRRALRASSTRGRASSAASRGRRRAGDRHGGQAVVERFPGGECAPAFSHTRKDHRHERV